MKLLIIGGTIFLGRHVVDAALKKGHQVTLFNRGRSNPDLFADNDSVEILRGDRTQSLDLLKGRSFDAVVDPSGYFPADVSLMAETLKDSVKQYIFISSVSVYKTMDRPGLNEDAELGSTDEPDSRTITGENYGPLKALCEAAAEQHFPGRSCAVRASLIVGPHDPTDRFTYWPVRCAQGDEILAPAGPDTQTQFIDVRDLAEWIVHAAEQGLAGAYTLAGPDYRLSMKDFLKACLEVANVEARLNWVSQDFQEQEEILPWAELPVYVGEADENMRGMLALDNSKALAAGLRCRAIKDTIRDTLDWYRGREDQTLKAGLKPEREAELLKRWLAR